MGVAAVQRDDGAPHLPAPFTVAAVGLKPGRALAVLAADDHGRRAQGSDPAVLGCLGDAGLQARHGGGSRADRREARLAGEAGVGSWRRKVVLCAAVSRSSAGRVDGRVVASSKRGAGTSRPDASPRDLIRALRLELLA
jgi:hypothetical protein